MPEYVEEAKKTSMPKKQNEASLSDSEYSSVNVGIVTQCDILNILFRF